MIRGLATSARIRQARPTDAPAIAALHVATFRETHGGGPSLSVRDQQWRQILARPLSEDFSFVIEEDPGSLLAFARGTLHDGGVPGFGGELDKIYVLRRHQRQGLGRLLLCHVASRFLTNGVSSMLLFGEAHSPSNAFYEANGAERILSPEGQFHGSYGWRDLQALVTR